MSKIYVLIALMAFSHVTIYAEFREDLLKAIKASDSQQVKNLLTADISGLSLEDEHEFCHAVHSVWKQREKTDLMLFQGGGNMEKQVIGARMMLTGFIGIDVNMPQYSKFSQSLFLKVTTPVLCLAYILPAVDNLPIDAE